MSLAEFITTHPDFRSSPLQFVTLPTPFAHAVANLDIDHLRSRLIPNALTYVEGSVWCLVAPKRPYLDRAGERTPTRRYQPVDPRTIIRHMDGDLGHNTMGHHTFTPPLFVQLRRGQLVTILPQRFWCWRDTTTLCGTYVAAINFMPTLATPSTNVDVPLPTLANTTTADNATNEPAGAALLGATPLHDFLP